jgi:hypothetical protein
MNYKHYEKVSRKISGLEDKTLKQLDKAKKLRVSTAIRYMWPDAYDDGRKVEVDLPGYKGVGLRRDVTRAKTYRLVSKKPFVIDHPKKVRHCALRDTPVALINHICDKHNARDTYRGELYQITVWDHGLIVKALLVRNAGRGGMHNYDIKAIVKDQTEWDIKDPDFKWDIKVHKQDPRMIQSLDDRQRLVLNIHI